MSNLESVPALLRAIAGSSSAKEGRHDMIFDEAASIIDRQSALIRDLVAALKPFADAVYNDNGDMTATPCGIDEYAKAYFVMRRIARARQGTDGS